MKRIAIIFCSMLIMVNTIPVVAGSFVFADNGVPAGYQQVSSNNQLGEAFIAYCKSRDSEITSSVLGYASTGAYSVLADCCRGIGFNIADLQSHLWYLNESNTPTKWFFDSTGINIYNQCFAYLIQEKGLSVGEPANNVTLSNDYTFTDDNGNSCSVTQINTTNNSLGASESAESSFITIGTPFIKEGGMDAVEFYENGGSSNYISFYKYQNLYSLPVKYETAGTAKRYFASTSSSNGSTYAYVLTAGTNAGTSERIGYPSIIMKSNGYLYIGITGQYIKSGLHYCYCITRITGQDLTTNVTISFTTNNKVINNNVQQGDTIINNEGDTINNNTNNNTTINYNPYPDNPNYDPNDPDSGTTTNPVNPSDPNGGDNININFPDIDIDLPEINWSIGDLSHKFPFSIPFDLYNMFSILNVEPQTPEIRGTVNLGIYQWPINWDLHQFDDTAALLRNVEFVGFVIGLIFVTRNIIKG